MDSYGIYKRANNLIQRYGTNDPIKLADDMGIWVREFDTPTELLGMYICKYNHRVIILNPNVNEYLYRMVAGHEIGHDQEHRDIVKNGLMKEFQLFNMTNITEYEANAFASHLLIDEKEMMELFKQGYDIDSAAKMLMVNINLILIKIQEMNRLGMDLKLPYSPDARFLRDTRY